MELRSTLPLFLSLLLLGLHARGQTLNSDILTADKAEKKLVHAVLAKDKDSEPTAIFSSDTPKISAFWKGKGLQLGDRLHAVWIAEDLGMEDRRDSKIMEARVRAYKPDDDGAFSLARPKEGWPLGKYRFELYVEDKLTETLKFTIESNPVAEAH
ncbi:MAG: hypothetical protein ABJB69_07500 [Spartobacteria bacterium]